MRSATSFKSRVLVFLVAGFLLLGCAKEGNPGATTKPSAGMKTCGEAQSRAAGLLKEEKFPEALSCYESALHLCSKHVKIMDGLLRGIADIGRLAPSSCSRCAALFDSISPSERIDYLRAAAGLDLFCAHGSRTKTLVNSLVSVEMSEYSLSDLGQLRGVIVEYENARLMHWSRNSGELLQHLKLGTKNLCSEGIFPSAMQSLEWWKTREDHPVGGLLAFWTIQPVESFDRDVENCLARAARDIEARFDHLLQHGQWQVKQWIDWYREHTQSGSP